MCRSVVGPPADRRWGLQSEYGFRGFANLRLRRSCPLFRMRAWFCAGCLADLRRRVDNKINYTKKGERKMKTARSMFVVATLAVAAWASSAAAIPNENHYLCHKTRD